ncbi:NAD kinase, partial [Neisseria sp. P0017.S010]
MKSPFKNIGIVTRPNTPEIQDTVHTLVSFLRENGFTIYLDELSVEEHCVYIQ